MPPRSPALLASLALTLAAGVTFAADAPRLGYLDAGEFDVTRVLEPAPVPGDPRYESDRRIFTATRSLKGGARYDLATRDVDYGVPALLADYSCAVGVALTPANAPKLVELARRAAADTSAQTGHAKDVYRRRRPYLIDHGDICQPKAQLGESYDYPSGHTTYGWTWALILASLAPDRATPILERGRAYGDSRFVCGAHNESAVEAGFLSAGATMAVIATKPAYQADLAAARAEMAALRADPAAPLPEGCEAEAAALRERALPRGPK